MSLPGGGSDPMRPAGSETNRWAVEFWTDPSLAVCPSGTVVGMQVSGSGGVSAGLHAPPYAEGVVVTEGSVYADWFVVLLRKGCELRRSPPKRETGFVFMV